MELRKDWNGIRKHFKKSILTNLHVSIASVDEHNNPVITPIGSLFLNKDLTGFYFENYPTKLPKYVEHNKHISVLSVNSGYWFWFKSLYKAKFISYPAIKLYGTLGKKRKATPKELEKLKRQLQAFRFFKKGYQELWGEMKFVREVQFYKAESVSFGKMTSHL